MTDAPFAVVIIGTLALISSYTQAGTMRGYVVDARGQCALAASSVRLGTMFPPPSDRHKHPTRFAQTTTDARGAFVIFVSARR